MGPRRGKGKNKKKSNFINDNEHFNEKEKEKKKVIQKNRNNKNNSLNKAEKEGVAAGKTPQQGIWTTGRHNTRATEAAHPQDYHGDNVGPNWEIHNFGCTGRNLLQDGSNESSTQELPGAIFRFGRFDRETEQESFENEAFCQDSKSLGQQWENENFEMITGRNFDLSTFLERSRQELYFDTGIIEKEQKMKPGENFEGVLFKYQDQPPQDRHYNGKNFCSSRANLNLIRSSNRSYQERSTQVSYCMPTTKTKAGVACQRLTMATTRHSDGYHGKNDEIGSDEPILNLKTDMETSDQGASRGILNCGKPAVHHDQKFPRRYDENYVRIHINSEISAPKPFHDLELVEQTTTGRQQESLGENFEKNHWKPDQTLGSAGRALCQNFRISGVDCNVSFDGTELFLFAIDEDLNHLSEKPSYVGKVEWDHILSNQKDYSAPNVEMAMPAPQLDLNCPSRPKFFGDDLQDDDEDLWEERTEKFDPEETEQPFVGSLVRPSPRNGIKGGSSIVVNSDQLRSRGGQASAMKSVKGVIPLTADPPPGTRKIGKLANTYFLTTSPN